MSHSAHQCKSSYCNNSFASLDVLPIWTTPHFYGATSHVAYIAGREVPIVIWSHQYNAWTLLQQIDIQDCTAQL